MKRAVITGLGIISSIGNNQQQVLYSLRHGRSGITFSEEMKTAGMRSHVWGNIKLDTQGMIDRKIVRFMSDASIYAYLSMLEAIKDSALSSKDYQNNPRVGVIAGSGGGSPRYQVFGADAMRGSRGLKGVGPYVVTKAMASGISACLATPFKIYGVSYSISSACATSAHCIGNAVEQIQMGKQDIIFAGGGEELSWELACEFDAMGALSTKYNLIPHKASRPYDVSRDGFVISGGAGIIVIEELEHALSRDAYIYAEIVGFAATSDGKDMVVPSGDGAARCMRMAIQNIDIPIDYINSHATSTLIGDLKELSAIREVFNKKIPYISATKAMTGHSLGAAGVQEIIYSLLMLKYNFIAASINIETLDESAKEMNILTHPIEKKIYSVMSNSFGFGGTNATLVINKYYK
ncbi:beta-ketoacyl-ACP synthase I [Candidatus Pantoea carbekii]|uniref:3-oxoacyl-[acyl-carrier-protein] synthase 1 n=1 Tax=Candidatus Pantoea carbekii TaxID=1235990 RepID=U3U834_9GAMM|nr:beta-ketoacyl-ACP synthase I [Candidatus Pantoea carbekii]AKC31983.1 3-oxoacyl- acyl-carrier-protein synthase I FabB [Candidatus Pantoea carbekii]BAO00504.1 FabB protein [Candidatus Pantoea carbekii]